LRAIPVLDFQRRVVASFPEFVYPERDQDTDHDDKEFAEQKTPIETGRHHCPILTLLD
jgi:hypothetical protein